MKCRLLFVNGLSLGRGIPDPWQLAIRLAIFRSRFSTKALEDLFLCRSCTFTATVERGPFDEV